MQPGEAIAQGKLRTGAKRGVMRLGEDGLILDEDLVDINGKPIPQGVIENLL